MTEPMQVQGIDDLNKYIAALVDYVKKPSTTFKKASLIMFADVINHFINEMGPDGRWQALKESTLENRRNKMKSSSKILQDSGELKNSISKNSSDAGAEVGTNKIYARIHQDGGTIPSHYVSPVKAKALHWGGSPGFFSKGHMIPDVNIPQRTFVYLSDEACQRILDLFVNDMKDLQ